MNWQVLKTEDDYNTAALRLMEIFHAPIDSSEYEELSLLMLLVKDYDERHYQLPELDALEVIKIKMQEKGLKNKDLETIIGSKGHVSAILSGNREITLKMAKRLKEYLGIPAEVFFNNSNM